MMRKIEDLDFQNKRVFLRGDIDVPVKNGVVQDSERLQYLLPTIRFLFSKNSRVLLAGHMGRPKNNQDFSLSTKHLVTTLYSLLKIEIVHFPTFQEVKLSSDTLGLLENLRFWPEEENNDENFAKQLTALADVYVNDAFAAINRNHASIVGVPKLLPHAAGLRLETEVEVLSRVLANPKKPQVVVIGGVKIETKLPVIVNLAKTADWVLIGGLLAEEARRENLQFPKNVILAKLTDGGKDISVESIEIFKKIIQTAGQIILNGAMGVFEETDHEMGTREVAQAVAGSKAEKIAGGDATILALKKFGFFAKIDWVSSGGGAMLEFLSGRVLPGITALE